MSKRAQINKLKKLLDGMPARLSKAFLAAIEQLKSMVVRGWLLDALRKGDVDEAITALSLDSLAFNAFQEAKRAAYVTSGSMTALAMPKSVTGRVIPVFNMSNRIAEEWLNANAGKALVDAYKQEMVATVRETIARGYAKGHHPNTIARAIIGTPADKGGVLGLTPQQASFVDGMGARLRSGKPGDLRHVLKHLTRRDKRFDHHIKKALETGEMIPESVIQKMLGRYEARLLKLRAENIARTETAMAVMGGKMSQWEMLLAQKGLGPEAVIKTWRHGGGVKDPRPHHQALNNKRVYGLYTPFPVGDQFMLHTHDPAGGPGECVNCTCDTLFSLDHSAGLT